MIVQVQRMHATKVYHTAITFAVDGNGIITLCGLHNLITKSGTNLGVVIDKDKLEHCSQCQEVINKLKL